MSEFITLDRNDPRFESYLLGSFSSDHCALPVRSLHINSRAEQITFQVLPVAAIERPPMILILAQVMRLDLLSLSLTPALAAWALFGFTSDAVMGAVALLFLHAAFFARNDFVDHLRGVDRLNEKGGSRVIQRGWLKATAVRKIFGLFFLTGAALALPVVIHHPMIAGLGIFGAIFGAFGYSHLRWSQSGWLVGGLSLFLCVGPLLCLGAYEVSAKTLVVNAHVLSGTSVNQTLVWLLGSLFGLVAVVYVETRHLISIVIDDEAELQTLPVRFGFDRAKKTLALFYFGVAIVLAALLFSLFHYLGLLIALPMVLIISRLGLAMYRVSSPLSSSLVTLLSRSNYLHVALGALVIALCLL